jgi:hypothetical protein
MFLKRSYNKKTGRSYLAIVHGYQSPAGHSKHKTIQSIGYLDDLEKQYPDPIAHFTAIAKEMDNERLASKSITITLDLNEQLQQSAANRKNYGHVVFSKIYHELELDRFLDNVRRHKNFKFNSEAIMRLLVFTRLLNPGSKRASLLSKDLFFDNFDFTLDDVYHALSHYDEIAEKLQRHLHQKITELYKRDTSLVSCNI